MGSITINDGSSLNQEQPLDIVNRINGLGDRLQSAIFAENFQDARKLGLMMLTALAIIPDGDKQGEAGASLRWDRNSIENLLNQIAKLQGHCQSGMAGLQIVGLNYQGCDNLQYRDEAQPSNQSDGGSCGC